MRIAEMPIHLLIPCLFLGSLLSANEHHAEFRRAVVVSKDQHPQLDTALKDNGFEVLNLSSNSPQGGARFQAFLNAIPTNGFAFIYIESLDLGGKGDPVIPFPDTSIALLEMAKQFHSVNH